MSDVYLKVYDLIFEVFGFPSSEEIWPEDNLTDDLGLDSLDCVELLMCVEEEFDVDIPDHEAEKLLTPYQIAYYLENEISIGVLWGEV